MNNSVAEAARQGGQLPFCWRGNAPPEMTQTMYTVWPGTRPVTLVLTLLGSNLPDEKVEGKACKAGGGYGFSRRSQPPVAREEARWLTSFE